MTTFEPGASVVFTQGLLSRPASTALRASSAAPIITDGLEVLVHEVMAAMTTEPWSTVVFVPSSSVTSVGVYGRPAGCPAGSTDGLESWPFSRSGANGSEAGKVSAISPSSLSSSTYEPSAARKAVLASASATRSCGRFGPASDGTMVDRSSDSSSEYRAGRRGSCHRPCSLAYASISATRSAGRPVSRR